MSNLPGKYVISNWAFHFLSPNTSHVSMNTNPSYRDWLLQTILITLNCFIHFIPSLTSWWFHKFAPHFSYPFPFIILFPYLYQYIFLWLQNTCVCNASHHYRDAIAETTHVVVGGGGACLSTFSKVQTLWSYFQEFGFVKLTAFNNSSQLFEYKKSSDGRVYDHFTISRDYHDILVCTVDSCSSRLATWASLWKKGGLLCDGKILLKDDMLSQL